MDRTLTYDSNGNDITCMKEFTALKYPCKEYDRTDCDERENYDIKTMKLSDIKIKASFKNTTPSEDKMAKCRQHWNKYQQQDRYIVVDNNNILIDGYVQYLILKEQGVEQAEIKDLSCSTYNYHNQMTTYIYGVHQNSKDTKERVWRVPCSWDGWEDDLSLGDKILVCTRRGISPIIITKIERSDKCPVNMTVRKVYRKLVHHE